MPELCAIGAVPGKGGGMTGLHVLGIALLGFFVLAFGGAWLLDRLLALADWWEGKR